MGMVVCVGLNLLLICFAVDWKSKNAKTKRN